MPGDKERRDFGRRLSAMLLDKEMSMSDLARAVWGKTRVDSRGYGAVVGKDRISSYCAGKTLPTALTARKLAKALACDVRDLLPNDAGDVGRKGRMIDIERTLRLLDVEAESNFVQAEAIDAINYLLRENARLRALLKAFVPETQWIDPAIPDTRPIDVMVRAGELRAAAAAIPGKVKDEAACPTPDEAP